MLTKNATSLSAGPVDLMTAMKLGAENNMRLDGLASRIREIVDQIAGAIPREAGGSGGTARGVSGLVDAISTHFEYQADVLGEIEAEINRLTVRLGLARSEPAAPPTHAYRA